MATCEAFCATYDTWRRAKAIIQKEGFTYKTAGGLERKRPEVGIAEAALRELRHYAGEFGLTPASRGRVAHAMMQGQLPLGDRPQAEEQRGDNVINLSHDYFGNG